MEPVIIHETDVFGTAYSQVAPSYDGPCRMEYEQCGSACSAVFPTVKEAHEAAVFAVGHLGGYRSATLLEAPGSCATHASWKDWAFR